jgi:DNA-binding NtrC family response regulator
MTETPLAKSARSDADPEPLDDAGRTGRWSRADDEAGSITCGIAGRREDTAAAEVLVVDDDEQMRGFLEETLREEGFAVRTEPDAFSALVRLLARTPDLVILDWRMPHMDGLALLESIRRCCGRLPIVFITAYSGPEIRRLALLNGACGFLAKPFATRELLSVMAAALRGSAVRAGRAPEPPRRGDGIGRPGGSSDE